MVHGNDFIYTSFRYNAEHRHRHFKAFLATQDPVINLPKRSIFTNWNVRPMLTWMNYICAFLDTQVGIFDWWYYYGIQRHTQIYETDKLQGWRWWFTGGCAIPGRFHLTSIHEEWSGTFQILEVRDISIVFAIHEDFLLCEGWAPPIWYGKYVQLCIFL